jgi:hypothetical protein
MHINSAVKPRWREYAGDLGVNGRTTSKWVFDKWKTKIGSGLNWHRDVVVIPVDEVRLCL